MTRHKRPSAGVASLFPLEKRRAHTRRVSGLLTHPHTHTHTQGSSLLCQLPEVSVCVRKRARVRREAETPGASTQPTLVSVRALEHRDVRREGAAAVVPGPGPGLPGCVHHQHDHVL